MVKKTTKPRRIEDKPFPRSTLETIDSAMHKFLTETLDINCLTTTGFRTVPVVWSSAERVFQSKRDQRIRDKDGALVLPLMTIERSNVTKDPSRKGTVFANIPPIDKVKGGSISVSRKINQEKTSNFENAHARKRKGQLNFPQKNEKTVYQTMTIPLPIYVTVQYEITLKSEYQEQMNQMITPFITRPGGINYVIIEEGRLRYEAFIQEDFSHNNNISNFSNEERKFETKVTIEVLGWLTGQDKNSLQPDYAVYENAVEIKIPRERIVFADQLLKGNGRLFGLEGIEFPTKSTSPSTGRMPIGFPPSDDATGGEQGPQGLAGVSVTNAQLVDYELIITLSDGTTLNLGNVRGAPGAGAEGALTTTNYVANGSFQEAPNGTRTTFTTAEAFVSGTQMVFRDGLLMSPGADNDYTVTNNTTIEFNSLSPPDSGINLRITYVQA